MTIRDRLYGLFEIPAEFLPFSEISELQRLHHVSLSAVPPWLLPAGQFANRFEHSLGVFHLADLATRHPDFSGQRTNLMIAALLHDIGTPPFSHVCDPFLVRQAGLTHEEAVVPLITGGAIADSIRQAGGDPETVGKLITGSFSPFSDLIAGTIDLDNLDNSLRWNVSGGIVPEPYYDPRAIARSYRIRNMELILDLVPRRDMDGWERDREAAYAYVYGNDNMAPGAMLTRMLTLAEKEHLLGDEFFRMTDAEAWNYLKTTGSAVIRRIGEAADRWKFFRQAVRLSFPEPDAKTTANLKHFQGNGELTDRLTDEFHLEPHQASIITGTSKAFKEHSILVTDAKGKPYGFGRIHNEGYVYVYVDSVVTADDSDLRAFIEMEQAER